MNIEIKQSINNFQLGKESHLLQETFRLMRERFVLEKVAGYFNLLHNRLGVVYFDVLEIFSYMLAFNHVVRTKSDVFGLTT